MLFVKAVLIRITNLFYEISFTNIQNHYPFKKSTILYFLILNRCFNNPYISPYSSTNGVIYSDFKLLFLFNLQG